MLTTQFIDATADLSPAWRLVYRGHAADADRDKIVPYLARCLRLAPESALLAMQTAPLPLLHFEDRARAREHQMALASHGCSCTVESVWKLRDWVIRDRIPGHCLQLVQQADEAGAEAQFAMLRLSKPMSRHALQQLCARIPEAAAEALSASDLLIMPQAAGQAGRARSLGDRLKWLLAGLPAESKPTAVIISCPEQGYNIAEILSNLERKLDEDAGAETSAESCMPEAGPDWLLAGTAWLELVRRGAPDDLEKHFDPEQARALRLDFPAFWSRQAEAPGEPREKILQQYLTGAAAREKARRSVIQSIDRMKNLPTLPDVAVEASRLAQSPDSNANQLAEIISRDPGLGGRILSSVNSAAFSLSREVESIQQALVILGFREVATLVLRLGSLPMFKSLPDQLGRELWEHSAKSGQIASRLARRVPGLVPSTAYTAALLHDVGKICLYGCAGPQMQEITSDAAELGLPAFELERQRLGLDHAVVGAMLLRRWGLSEVLADAVEHHHGPTPGQDAIQTLPALTGLADHLVHRLELTEPQGDELRLRQAHQAALQSTFGELTGEMVDLLAEDMFSTEIPFDDDF